MKSIEEKAKAYDKAIKIAKDSLNDPDFPGLIRADVVFPELEESEDERIRKGLIEHLKELKKQSVEGSHLKRPVHYDAWIDLLEKQCEQKDYYTKQELIDMGFSFTLNGDIVTPDEMMDNMKIYLGWKEKQSEQNLDKSTRTCKEEQKPAWSEEDSTMLVNLVAWIEGKWGTLGGKVGGKEAYISFLKSLKERYTWKPSDEQINALDNILKHFRMLNAEGETIDNLIELKEQLKKLRGE